MADETVKDGGSAVDFDALKERVYQWQLMELPGQPAMMHMGTFYLVNDLWDAVKALRDREG